MINNTPKIVIWVNKRSIMLDYTISSGNIFQDLGFANAEEKLAKVKLASVIADILEQRQITPQ
jgi:hypothetical protein